MEIKSKKNPFAGYEERFKKKNENKKMNPIHETVNMYYQLAHIGDEAKEFYKGRYNYGKLASEAKRLLVACDNNLDDALWSLDKMRYKAEKGHFDWSISTCLKHDLK